MLGQRSTPEQTPLNRVSGWKQEVGALQQGVQRAGDSCVVWCSHAQNVSGPAFQQLNWPRVMHCNTIEMI